VARRLQFALPSPNLTRDREQDMKRILVGLDTSPRAPSVLAEAVALATANPGCKLNLFHAVGLPAEIPASVYAFEGEDLYEVLARKARESLDALAATVPSQLLDRAEVILGVPWQAICREAKERDVDLIVVGSHGYSGLDRVIGTTAAKIVNHADRSVLVVRRPTR
jgi:nucleotide-binding universal stress UspA family protein